MHQRFAASLVFALAVPVCAAADSAPPSDIQALRQEIAAMRASYEARLQAMEQRLKAAEATAAPIPTQSAPLAQPAPPSTPTASTAAPASAQALPSSANSFNPAISLILSGIYARTSRDPADYAISGFHLPAGSEFGPGTRGFTLSESELGFSASIDPWLHGTAAIAVHGDDSISVEEAYIQTTSLGSGLTLKAGRFFSSLGYLNSQHAHTWDFVDNPLAYQAMLGTQYGDDGVQVSWLAPTDQYIELGLELGRGRSFPGSDSSRNGAGMTALTAHTGGDIGDNHNWRAGLSLLNAKATDQELVTDSVAGPGSFSGKTHVWVLDGVWKWAPGGNATRTNFKLQGEYIRSTRDGRLAYNVNGPAVGVYRVTQSGWYLQGVYQFMPRWRVGLRTERLDAGMADYDINVAPGPGDGFRPHKNTLMLDFNPSEFSRVRLQLAQDRASRYGTDHQLFLQYQVSLGAHGAHAY